jgi:hypothetical protein
LLACGAITCFVIGSGGIERSLAQYAPAAEAILPLGVVIYVAWFFAYGWREASHAASSLSTTPHTDTILAFHVPGGGPMTSAHAERPPHERTRTARPALVPASRGKVS